jgi:hypothetical protein
MTTTLLETGSLADRGYPTGRSISFMNGFAIRGQFFNFSTSGQWTWDEITVAVPASVDAPAAVDRILHAVQHETSENSRIAEQEWKRGTHGGGLSRFRTDPAVNLRPSASGIDLEVRYVTRASEGSRCETACINRYSTCSMSRRRRRNRNPYPRLSRREGAIESCRRRHLVVDSLRLFP